jgi:hypothetical protein
MGKQVCYQEVASGAGRTRIPCMNNFGLILRNIVFFLFPVPFLLNFVIEHGKDWTAWVAYH